jgi:septal ring factor EnvC (AmiA/AmiB activator)
MGNFDNLDTGDRMAIAIKGQPTNWAKWIVIVLTSMSLVVAAVVWAGTEHSDIKTWTAEQDYATKQDLEETVEKRYVPKEDFARVEQSLSDQKEDIEEVKEKLDKIYDLLYARKK